MAANTVKKRQIRESRILIKPLIYPVKYMGPEYEMRLKVIMSNKPAIRLDSSHVRALYRKGVDPFSTSSQLASRS